MILKTVGVIAAFVSFATAAEAASVVGKIVFVEGHLTPACRLIMIKRTDNGALEYYRVLDMGSDNSILSVAITALALNRDVTVSYTAGATTGCGTEPRIEFLRMQAN